MRTCVGCRKRELAAELLRVVAVSAGNGEHAVIVDTVPPQKPGQMGIVETSEIPD